MKAIVTTQKLTDNTKSKTYLKYEKLLNDIERQRQFVNNMEDGLDKASNKINTELAPLEQARHSFLREYLMRLDELAQEIGIGKYNREWFDGYMADESASLLEYFGHQDKQLSALYRKYAGTTIEEMVADEEAIKMAKALSDLFGYEVDFKDILEKGESAYFEEHRSKIQEHLHNKQQADNAFFEPEGDHHKNTAEEKKLSKEKADFTKDARSIYMRLIKKFHPDLEIDDALKEQKTEIVKQVTKAYQENDFFTLLKLQITYLDDNETDAAAIADDMLKRYNKILQKQLNELQDQISDMHFGSGTIIADFIDKNGKFSPQKFAARRREITKESDILKTILADSKKRPKGWFKEQIASIKDMGRQDMMKDIMAGMFNDMRF